jgi:ubiquinone/menaquinone biosynthesis C-methylase UbiE
MTELNHKNHDEEVGTYFDKAAVVFDTFYDHKRSSFMQWIDRKFRSDVFERYRLTFETLESLTGKTVIDIGCGSGPYVVEAANRGSKRVVGIDMAENMLDLGRQRAIAAGVADKCEFVLGTFPQDCPNERFDYGIVMGVMDYVADPQRFITALGQQICQRAVLAFPSIHWFRTPVRKSRYWIKKCPVYFYKPTKIKEYATAAGFKDIKIKKIAGAGMDYFVTISK